MSASEQNKPAFDEPAYAKPAPANAANLPFYVPNIDKYLTPDVTKFFEEYSHVPQDLQSAHVHDIRDQAWAIRTYPCTGLGVWLAPFIGRSPAYATILSRLQDGGLFLDVGCFLGADMRQLAYDGAPSDRMTGLDVVDHWNVGFALYRDRGSFRARFVQASLLDAGQPEMAALRGAVDVVSVSAVLHQWDWEGQVAAASAVASFSKTGTLVVGYQIGRRDGRAVKAPPLNVEQFVHDPATFGRLWDEVGRVTGTKWRTQASLLSWAEVGWDAADMGWMPEGAMPLEFVVTREA